MYTVTFYSFKGGVGRTMALTNVAMYLAQIGKRVLVVDFDLEAPGIDTLALSTNASRRDTDAPGIVEFVHDYLKGESVPDVREYVYEAEGAGRDGGRLWVMPAGRVDDSYGLRLSKINWVDLYERQDGYVLFEDMKAQWEQSFQPDYVLIDSRTGMTDVGGICTRQLPDAVVLLYIPNEQNLRGLAQVVTNIRAEAKSLQQKQIALHFVMSNVPDLDDEELILERRDREFRRALRIKESPIVVHRYDSLALLNQAIFTRDRPRSRLAKEYQTLVARMRGENPEDAGGALDYLRRLVRTRVPQSPLNIDDRLARIRQSHPSNGEILAALARVRQRQGRVAESIELLQEALRRDYDRSSAVLQLAESWQLLGNAVEASRAARSVFESVGAEADELARALEIIRLTSAQVIVGIASSRAVQGLPPDGAVWLAANLAESRAELREAKEILVSVIGALRAGVGVAPRPMELRRSLRTTRSEGVELGEAGERIAGIEARAILATAQHTLGLCLIGLGEFDNAATLISEQVSIAARFNIADAFNFAIAEWGRRERPSPELFAKVLELAAADDDDESPNNDQCLAIASWAVGDRVRAFKLLERARTAIARRTAPEFSCWRYLRVRRELFLHDLGEMELLFGGDERQPRFLLRDEGAEVAQRA
jgi:MinD-like ATPase involved in chromosome partitioning or flagellar assembly